MALTVKLAERPGRAVEPRRVAARRQPSSQPDASGGSPLGLAVRDLDRDDVARLQLPSDVRGVLIARVDPIGAAFDADLERGQVILEVNRRPVASARRVPAARPAAARPGDVLTLYLYLPDEDAARAAHRSASTSPDRPASR